MISCSNVDAVIKGYLPHSHLFNLMLNKQSRASLYRRVKFLTSIGEHAEAAALFSDLLARKNQDMDRQHETGNS